MQVRQVPKSSCFTAVRPSRLNLAGWCIYCVRRWCESPRCIAMHQDSIWGPCDRCGGTGMVDMLTQCDCHGGVVEYSSQVEAAQAWLDTTDVRSPLDEETEPARTNRWSGPDVRTVKVDPSILVTGAMDPW